MFVDAFRRASVAVESALIKASQLLTYAHKSWGGRSIYWAMVELAGYLSQASWAPEWEDRLTLAASELEHLHTPQENLPNCHREATRLAGFLLEQGWRYLGDPDPDQWIVQVENRGRDRHVELSELFMREGRFARLFAWRSENTELSPPDFAVACEPQAKYPFNFSALAKLVAVERAKCLTGFDDPAHAVEEQGFLPLGNTGPISLSDSGRAGLRVLLQHYHATGKRGMNSAKFQQAMFNESKDWREAVKELQQANLIDAKLDKYQGTTVYHFEPFALGHALTRDEHGDGGEAGVDTKPESPTNSGEGPPKKTKGGRRSDTDAKADKRIFDAWGTKQHATYSDLALQLGGGLKTADIRKAIDRHRKRIKRNSASDSATDK